MQLGRLAAFAVPVASLAFAATPSRAQSEAAAPTQTPPAPEAISPPESTPSETPVSDVPADAENEPSEKAAAPSDEEQRDQPGPPVAEFDAPTPPPKAAAPRPEASAPTPEIPVEESPEEPVRKRPPENEDLEGKAALKAEPPEFRELPYEPSQQPTPFDQGRIRLAGGLSWASTPETDWTILAIGAGVFVLDGLAVEVDTTFWLGGDPFIATVTPGLRYVFTMIPSVKPYIGNFYRRYFIENQVDANAVGARAGVYFILGDWMVVGAGAVYEHILESDVFAEQDEIYPELSFAMSF